MPPRLPGWDYRAPGVYFVTACVSGRRELFGSISGSSIHVSPLGQLVDRHIVAESALFQTSRAHVVMPDHVHVLLALGRPGGPSIDLATVVRRIKGNVIREARQSALIAISDRLWQRGFFDRVVRNDAEHEALLQYISTNPLRWALGHAARKSSLPSLRGGALRDDG